MKLSKFEEIIKDLFNDHGSLRIIKLFKDITGKTLLESRDIVFEAKSKQNPTKEIMNILRTSPDWNLIKSNIRKYKPYVAPQS